MKQYFRSIYQYITKHPKTDLLFVGIGLVVFITIALLNATRASIWFDEGFSAYIAQFSFWDIARYTATDVHPPLYYWLLKIWSSLFGTTELAYRSLSILFGAAAAVVAFFFTKKLFGRMIAWLSFASIVISPMLIRYSDEARMYTLVSLIVFSATYVYIKALETNSRKYWIWYGVLVSLGMWTHYFTALAWLAHWVWRATQIWRKGNTFKQFRMRFFTKPWVRSYLLAIIIFIPWLPFMAVQLGAIQGGGFWIGKVSVDTPANFFTNYFYYLERGEVKNWLAFLVFAVIITAILALPRAYRALNTKERKYFLLIASLAFVPPILLFLSSLPPLRSSFVERYLLPSYITLSIFFAIVFIKGLQSRRVRIWRIVIILTTFAMMIFGVTNVYKYGNFNKNSETHIYTREIVQAAQRASADGTPIVAHSPWLFYEAIPYTTNEHPVYFIDEATEYKYGSVDMLKYNDQHKIKDLEAFKKQHPLIWYVGFSNESNQSDVKPYQSSWQALRTITIKDEITGKSQYRATLYKVSGE